MAPRFPTFLELVGESVAERSPEPSKELFEALMADPRVLFQELLEDPSRFDEGVAELLQEIITGTKKFSELSRTDRDLLNHATIDFATNKRPTPEQHPPSGHQAGQRADAAQAAMSSADVPELEWRESGHHMHEVSRAVSSAPTFWWEKKD